MIGDTEYEGRTWLEDTGSFRQHRIQVRNMLQDRIADSARKMLVRERRICGVRFDQPAIGAIALGFVNWPVPGVETHIDFAFKGQGGKMTVAAAHVIDRGGQVEIMEPGLAFDRRRLEFGYIPGLDFLGLGSNFVLGLFRLLGRRFPVGMCLRHRG